MAGPGIVTDSEVIFESWLFKLRGEINSQLLHLSGAWNKKYFILFRKSHRPVLQYYKKKPKSAQEQPRGVLMLDEHYRVEKKPAFRGKDFVCRLITSSRVLYLASDKEHIHTLLMFFLNAQIRLNETLESDCFVVRPDNSDDHRRIGARGAMCLLHVSSWGVSLALQLSKCILAQWPIRCIRTYESSGKGRFSLETGNHAPTGCGTFVFNTRSGQDNVLFDRLDSVINEVTALQGLVSARVSNMSQSQNQSDLLLNEYQRLAALTYVCSDSSSIIQLKRISRDIYDHLAEHLGSASSQHATSSSVADIQHSPASAIPINGFARRNGSSNVIMSSQYLLTGSNGDGQSASNGDGQSASVSPPCIDESFATYSCEQRTGSVIEQRAGSSVLEDHSNAVDRDDRAALVSLASYVNVDSRSRDSVNNNNESEYIGMSETTAVGGIPSTEMSYAKSPKAADLYSYARTPDFGRFASQQKSGVRSEKLDPVVGEVQTSGANQLQQSMPSTNQNPPIKSNSRPTNQLHTSSNQNNVPIEKSQESNETLQTSTNQNVAFDSSNQSLELSSSVAMNVPGIKMSSRSRVFTRNMSTTNSSPI